MELRASLPGKRTSVADVAGQGEKGVKEETGETGSN